MVSPSYFPNKAFFSPPPLFLLHLQLRGQLHPTVTGAPGSEEASQPPIPPGGQLQTQTQENITKEERREGPGRILGVLTDVLTDMTTAQAELLQHSIYPQMDADHRLKLQLHK